MSAYHQQSSLHKFGFKLSISATLYNLQMSCHVSTKLHKSRWQLRRSCTSQAHTNCTCCLSRKQYWIGFVPMLSWWLGVGLVYVGQMSGQQFAVVYWVSFDIGRLLTLNLFLCHVARRRPALYQFNVGPVICTTPWFSSVECLRPLFCTVHWWEERVIQKHQIWNQRKQKLVKLYHMRNWPGNLTKLNPEVICEKLPFWSASNFTWKKVKISLYPDSPPATKENT